MDGPSAPADMPNRRSRGIERKAVERKWASLYAVRGQERLWAPMLHAEQLYGIANSQDEVIFQVWAATAERGSH